MGEITGRDGRIFWNNGISLPTSKVRMSLKGISLRRICNPPELNIRIYNPLCLLSDFVLR